MTGFYKLSKVHGLPTYDADLRAFMSKHDLIDEQVEYLTWVCEDIHKVTESDVDFAAALGDTWHDDLAALREAESDGEGFNVTT